jgi:chaperonin cofactor prefoldin
MKIDAEELAEIVEEIKKVLQDADQYVAVGKALVDAGQQFLWMFSRW